MLQVSLLLGLLAAGSGLVLPEPIRTMTYAGVTAGTAAGMAVYVSAAQSTSGTLQGPVGIQKP